VKAAAWISFVILVAVRASGADLGSKLNLRQDAQGIPVFGGVYTLADDPDGLNYILNYTTTLTAHDLQGLPSRLKWNIYLESSKSYLLPWSEKRVLDKAALILNQMKISDQEALKLLLVNQSGSSLVFAYDQKNTPAYFLAIGEICLRHSDLFKDLSGHGKKCDQLTQDDVGPAASSQFNLRSFSCDIISDGLMHPPKTHFQLQVDLDDTTYSPLTQTIAGRVRRFLSLFSPPVFDKVLVFKEKCDAPASPNFQYCKLLASSANLFGGKASIEAFGYVKPDDRPGFTQMWVTPKQPGVEYANGLCQPESNPSP
jgi:hypothetical protein